VHGGEPAPPRFGVEHGEIGEAHQPFRFAQRRTPVDERRDASEAVAAARCEHRFDVGIERLLKLCDASSVATGQIAVSRE
jgi:hypothetical protein